MSEESRCPQCGHTIPARAPGGQCPYCLMKLAMGAESAEGLLDPKQTDRDLLFGIFALQLQFIGTEDFADAAALPHEDPLAGIADKLVTAGLITQNQRVVVDRLVDEAVNQHDGDAYTTLKMFGGAMRQSLGKEAATRLGIPLNVEDDPSGEFPAVDETPGRYSRKSEYSRGGMGRILLVHDEYLSRDVALKELIPPRDPSHGLKGGDSPMRSTSTAAVRFLREAKVTGQLEHPAIVPVYELGRRANGTLYYTMKLVRGQTLAQALRNVSTLKERLTYLTHFADLCQAIGYAHSRHVLHRDIKPANIMIGEFGETVVIDWGLAKIVGQTDVYEDELRATWSILRGGAPLDPAKTAPGARLGTPHYMAPEQARGLIQEIDERTDVFALGIVLYEMLTGVLPFTGDTVDTVFARVIESAPTPIRQIAPEVPAELAGICEKAMRKERDDRYANAKELADEIHRFLTGAVVHAYEYSTGEVLRRFYRRRKAVINVAALALVVLLGLGAYSYVNIAAARDAAVAANRESTRKTYVSQIRLANEYLTRHAHTHAREILWDADPALRNWEWGLLLNLAYPEIYRVEAVSRFAADPTSAYLAVSSRTQPLRLLDQESGEVRAAFDDSTIGLVDRMAFAPNGATLLGRCIDGKARLWNVATRQLLHTLGDFETTLSYAEFDPSGARVLLAANGRVPAQIFQAETGEAGPTFGGNADEPAYTDVKWSVSGDYVIGADERSVVNVWSAASGEALGAVTGHAATLSPDNALLAVAEGATVHLYPMPLPSSPIRSLTASDGRAAAVAFSPDGQRLAAPGATTVRVWTVDTGEPLHTFEHGFGLTSMAFDEQGKRLLSYGNEAPIRVWDVETGVEIGAFSGHEAVQNAAGVPQAAFLPNSNRVASVGVDRTLQVWEPETASAARPLLHLEGETSAFAYADQGEFLAMASTGGEVAIVDAAAQARRVTFQSLPNLGHTALSFAPGAGRIAATLDPFTVMVLDSTSGEIVTQFAQHNGPVQSVAFSPDGKTVASGAGDHTVQRWDAETGAVVSEWSTGGDIPDALAFRPDGRALAAGGSAGRLFAWDPSGDPIATIDAHTGEITAIAWAPGGAMVATASNDGAVRLWDGATFAPIATLAGHNGPVLSVAFAPSGERLYTVGGFSGLKTWDTASWEELLTLVPASQGVGQVAPGPGARDLVCGTRAGVSLWRAAPWVDDATGDESNTPWRARYELRRGSAHPAASSVADSVTPLIVPTTREVLEERFQRLLAVLDGEAPAPVGAAGLLLNPGARHAALARVGMRANDRLVSINRLPLDNPATAARVIASALDALEQQEELPFELLRAGVSYHGRWRIVPLIHQSLDIRPTRQDALAAFMALTSPPASRGDKALERNRAYAVAMGEPISGDGAIAGYFIGFWRYSPNAGELAKAFQTLGLADSERVMKIDGTPVTSNAQFAAFCANARDVLAAGTPFHATLETERGEFRRTIFEWTVN